MNPLLRTDRKVVPLASGCILASVFGLPLTAVPFNCNFHPDIARDSSNDI
jgi:hypothetical protein